MKTVIGMLAVFLYFALTCRSGDSEDTNNSAYKTGFYTSRMPWDKEYQQWMNQQYPEVKIFDKNSDRDILNFILDI